MRTRAMLAALLIAFWPSLALAQDAPRATAMEVLETLPGWGLGQPSMVRPGFGGDPVVALLAQPPQDGPPASPRELADAVDRLMAMHGVRLSAAERHELESAAAAFTQHAVGGMARFVDAARGDPAESDIDLRAHTQADAAGPWADGRPQTAALGAALDLVAAFAPGSLAPLNGASFTPARARADPPGVGAAAATLPSYFGAIATAGGATCWAFAIGGAGPTAWTDDALVSIDLGGSDRYVNNAGGSTCLPYKDCNSTTFTLQNHADLGTDSDDYGAGTRSCGVHGGGFWGFGFLLDQGGDDDYRALDSGTNGGGYNGQGLLIDFAGDDEYVARHHGGNGGGSLGRGWLYDFDGFDQYTAGDFGTNGGGFSEAHGVVAKLSPCVQWDGSPSVAVLLRAIGRFVDCIRASLANLTAADVYQAATAHGCLRGSIGGHIHDSNQASHYSKYVAGSFGTNGGAYGQATGLITSIQGSRGVVGLDHGVNGGAAGGGIGCIFSFGPGDCTGSCFSDQYQARDGGTNGGAVGTGSRGLLFDTDSHDRFTAGLFGNGAADGAAALGVLLDRSVPALNGDQYADAHIGTCSDCTVPWKPGGPPATRGFQIDA